MPFVVLEGLDGAGKSTQVKKIQLMLEERQRAWKYVHFPRFDAPIHGELIARFLRGELGSVEQVDPYLVALLYAGDRREAAPMIREWLDRGYFVLVDRYVYSNIAYQCAKITDPIDKETLATWIRRLEFDFNAIPRPDRTLFLDVPFGFTQRKLSENRTGNDRDYLQGKADIHEKSLSLQQSVRETYLWQARTHNDIHVINCANDSSEMLSPDEIFKKIQQDIQDLM